MLALYRKYRPSDFSKVIGQEHIITIIKNSIKMGKTQHAYLFCGPKGTGKTTIARIIAKAVNCLNLENLKQKGEPCLKCENCQEILNNRSIDIIEIDAASNRGINEIRELREKSKFTPTKLKYKVFIIDEAHMLTTEAFNALLKTLEEPPAHVIFILATTEAYKLPETIISRCQRFNLRKIQQDKIIKHLNNIVVQENIKVEDNVTKLIAANSDGSSRDSLSLLGSLTVYGDEIITFAKAKELLGFSDEIYVIKLIDCLAIKDVSSAVKLINQLNSNGINMGQYTDNLIDYLRKLLLLKINPQFSTTSEFNYTKEHLEKILKQAYNFNCEQLIKFIDSIIQRKKEIYQILFQQLPLEMAIAENFISKEFDKNKTKVNNFKIAKKVDVMPNFKPITENISDKKSSKIISFEEIKVKWPSIIAEIKKTNFTLGGILNNFKLISASNNYLTLASQYGFHKDKMNEFKNRVLIEDIFKKLFNQKIFIKYILISDLSKEKQEKINKEFSEKKTKKAENLYNAAISALGVENI